MGRSLDKEAGEYMTDVSMTSTFQRNWTLRGTEDYGANQKARISFRVSRIKSEAEAPTEDSTELKGQSTRENWGYNAKPIKSKCQI